MTDQPGTLTAALLQLQRDLPQVHKGETARVETQKGSYSYQFAGLSAVTEAVLPRLTALGLVWICRPTLSADGRPVLAYALVHVDSGERETGEMPLLIPANPTPQQIGSAISYGRRYALLAVTGVAPAGDDDDAASASVKPARKAAPRRTAGADDKPAKSALDGPMSDVTRRAMHAAFNDAGIRDRDGKLNFAAEVLGMETLASSTELTERQARQVVQALREGVGDDHTEAPA